MTPDYELVAYQPELKRQVIDLQTHLWSPSAALNTAYFNWKYERNPYLDTPLIYLAMHQERAVGMRGFFGAQWEGGAQNQRVIGLYADDTVIDPGHRNRGLISRIMWRAFEDLARRGYEYVFNLSAGPVMLLSSLSMGWRSAGAVRPMQWRSFELACDSGLRRLLARLPPAARHLDRPVARWSETRGRSLETLRPEQAEAVLRTTPWIVFDDQPRPAAMAGLVERIANSGRLRHVRDSQYFDWRFQNPLSRYRFLFWEQDRLEGYLVLQEYTSPSANHEVINIVDWEGTSSAVQAGLLQAALRIPRHRYLRIWSGTLSPETIALLHQKGFAFPKQAEGGARHCPAVLVRPVRSERLPGRWVLAGRSVLDLTNWDLRMLYSMHG